MLVQLAVALIRAVHVASRGWRASAMAGLILAVLFDSVSVPLALWPTALPRGLDRQIGAASHGNVLELPTGLRDGFGEIGRFDHRALVHQTILERPLVGGFAARLSPRIKQEYARLPDSRR